MGGIPTSASTVGSLLCKQKLPPEHSAGGGGPCIQGRSSICTITSQQQKHKLGYYAVLWHQSFATWNNSDMLTLKRLPIFSLLVVKLLLCEIDCLFAYTHQRSQPPRPLTAGHAAVSRGKPSICLICAARVFQSGPPPLSFARLRLDSMQRMKHMCKIAF